MKSVVVFLLIASFSRSSFGASATQTWVIGWGDNTVGQTGLPFTANHAANGPISVPGGVYTNVAAISAGGSHALALSVDGSVFGWGNNEVGEAAGVKTTYPYFPTGRVKIADSILSDVIAVSAGDWFSLALKRDGTVVSWGKGRGANNRNQLEVPSGLSNVIAIAAGGNCSLVLRKDGSVFGWGDRRPPMWLSNIVAIAVGHGEFSPCLALTSDHKVIEWLDAIERRDPSHITRVPAEATGVAAIAAGRGHRLALRQDGTVVGWGRNRDGQATGVPTRSFPSETNGLVRLDGQLLSNVVAIAAGGDFSLALKSDGTVIGWGDNASQQARVPNGLSNIVAIAAGENFCLAITTNAAVAARFRQ